MGIEMKKFLLVLFLAAGCVSSAKPVQTPKREVASFTVKYHEACQCLVYITVYKTNIHRVQE